MVYYKKIDGLRFVAISLVFIAHFGGIINRYIDAAYYGVDLFFVISGFLITSILINSKGSFWDVYKNFIGRRTLRIFPIYYLTILVLFLLRLEVVQNYLFYFLTYTFNYARVYFRIDGYIGAGPFWSLCVEEQFYLFWPFIVLSLRKNPRLFLGSTIAIIIFSFLQWGFGLINGIEQYNFINLLTRMGSFGFGGVAAILFCTNKIPNRVFRSALVEYVVLAILMLTLIEWNLPLSTYYWATKAIMLAFCSFYIVLKCVHSDFKIKFINQFLKNRIVVFIGSISYGLYIYHGPIAYYLDTIFFNPIWPTLNFSSLGYFHKIRYWPWLIKFPLYSGLSTLMAMASFRYIEQPILGLKDKYFKSN